MSETVPALARLSLLSAKVHDRGCVFAQSHSRTTWAAKKERAVISAVVWLGSDTIDFAIVHEVMEKREKEKKGTVWFDSRSYGGKLLVLLDQHREFFIVWTLLIRSNPMISSAIHVLQILATTFHDLSSWVPEY